MKKIITAILAHKSEDSNKSIDTLKQTWAGIENSDVSSYFYFGNSSECYINNDEIYLTTREDYNLMINRTIECFDFLLNNFEFEYIFRTNLSSYVNKGLLSEFIDNKPKKSFYSSIIGNHVGINFGSGCGYFLSRDLVEYAVSQKNVLRTDIIDDVAIGYLLRHINIYPGSRKDYTNTNLLSNIEKDFQGHYHYRCRIEPRNIERETIKKLHKLIYNI